MTWLNILSLIGIAVFGYGVNLLKKMDADVGFIKWFYGNTAEDFKMPAFKGSLRKK